MLKGRMKESYKNGRRGMTDYPDPHPGKLESLALLVVCCLNYGESRKSVESITECFLQDFLEVLPACFRYNACSPTAQSMDCLASQNLLNK